MFSSWMCSSCTRRVVLLKETLPTWILGAFLVWKQSVYCSNISSASHFLFPLVMHTHTCWGSWRSLRTTAISQFLTRRPLERKEDLYFWRVKRQSLDTKDTRVFQSEEQRAQHAVLMPAPDILVTQCETCVKHAVFTPRFACVIRMTHEIPAPRQV